MADPRTTAAKLAARLRSTLDEELHSVVLFGSVPRGEAIPGVSDLNLLVLLAAIPAAQLVRVAPVFQQWIRDGNTPPHLYSLEEWEGMRDTFAIEIADMQDAREVLWGADPIAGHTPVADDLRTHAEQESRETVLHLRMRLMLAADNPDDVGLLLLSGLPSFTAYLRAVLRLRGEEPGLDSRAVIERAAAAIDSNPAAMLACWEARRTHRTLAVSVTDPLVEQYTTFANDLVRYIDGMPAAPRNGLSTPARQTGRAAAERR